MKVQAHRMRSGNLEGWPVRIVSYQAGDRFHCQIDNVEPGANIARAIADTREEAERKAIEDATRRLARTRVRS